jgi:hypothetical protein
LAARSVMARADHPFARVVPYRWRWAHRWFAWASRYFWLPCPLCGRAFGGHEFIDGTAGSIPKPGYEPPGPYGPFRRVVICPACVTRRRDGIEQCQPTERRTRA